jgi:hypothetical protein
MPKFYLHTFHKDAERLTYNGLLYLKDGTTWAMASRLKGLEELDVDNQGPAT